VLAFPNFNKPFQVNIYASNDSIGAILNKEDRPIAYYSEKLNNAKRNYIACDKEFYVVVQDLKKLRHYLLSREFILYIDNIALQYIMQQPKLNHKHIKWVEYLRIFTFVLNHINGQSNQIVDSLSRRWIFLQESHIQVLKFNFCKGVV